MGQVKCRDCGEIYLESERACPQCGSTHKIIEIECEASSMAINFQVEHIQGINPHLPSKKRMRWDMISRDTVQRADGVTPIHHSRLIDKDEDIYMEKVVNLQTGETIHECEEPLSHHTGHGSAKFDRKESDKGK